MPHRRRASSPAPRSHSALMAATTTIAAIRARYTRLRERGDESRRPRFARLEHITSTTQSPQKWADAHIATDRLLIVAEEEHQNLYRREIAELRRANVSNPRHEIEGRIAELQHAIQSSAGVASDITDAVRDAATPLGRRQLILDLAPPRLGGYVGDNAPSTRRG